MKKDFSTMIGSAVAGNAIHLIIALCSSFMVDDKYHISLVISTLLIYLGWFFMGWRVGTLTKHKPETRILYTALLSIIPILLFLIPCQILRSGVLQYSPLKNYNIFYFLGAPTLYWNKPFLPIMNLFKDINIYVQFDMNVVIVFFVIFLGGYYGMNNKRRKRNNKKVSS